MTRPDTPAASDPAAAREEQGRAITRLLALLETEDALDPRVMEARAELAEATARTGEYEDAIKQADELLKDAQREHGPEHPTAVRSGAAVDLILELAGLAGLERA
ncbi:hypothetical protein [Brachybacterium phenoliresistens]|uniref:Tetratricopeptide repeat protein n=1 Tax=Brachybacterium phenoliresistens TaxID=396014 RepID=Z9JQF8_9MICO|nr:hypothetical protein [Brachybacterium phenoliresistens]EWS79982.1 hypothetical protein BF93_08600 [Brachybacterium phenoliresistens]